MDVYQKAQDLLGRRPHFTAELRRKLQQRGYAAADIAMALDRLTDLGYLDDLTCARRLAEELFRRRGYGRRVISGRLRQRGVDAAMAAVVVEELFAALEPGELDDVFLRLWSRRRSRPPAAFCRYLYQRGFLTGEIEEFRRRRGRELGLDGGDCPE
ncbi:MAG: regulatory protein RecX [Deltaproteobacteria bacterium]|nr:regulatory protein RecX [Deltaproteobacteria bacterium]